MKKYLANKHWKKATIISSTLIVFAIALFWVSPFVFTLINSFKPLRESIDSSNFFKLPINSTQNNYSKSFSDINYFHAFLLTLGITIASNLSIVIFGSLAAWQLARTKKWYAKVIFYTFLVALIIPFQSIMFPLINDVAVKFNLRNVMGLIVLYTGFGISLSVFMIHGFIATIPLSLEEVAKVEGLGPIKTFFKVVIPLLRQILTTILILNTMWIWNDFLLPNLIKNAGSYNSFTLIVNLYSNIGVHALNPGQIMAGVTSIIIPVVVFFIVMQKNIVSGITNGAIK